MRVVNRRGGEAGAGRWACLSGIELRMSAANVCYSAAVVVSAVKTLILIVYGSERDKITDDEVVEGYFS